jgi:hypothetical protein
MRLRSTLVDTKTLLVTAERRATIILDTVAASAELITPHKHLLFSYEFAFCSKATYVILYTVSPNRSFKYVFIQALLHALHVVAQLLKRYDIKNMSFSGSSLRFSSLLLPICLAVSFSQLLISPPNKVPIQNSG